MDQDHTVTVPAKVAMSPHRSTRKTAQEAGVSYIYSQHFAAKQILSV
jgi:hypothetical protein